jgi:DNA-binding transcriptional LysR family regulator
MADMGLAFISRHTIGFELQMGRLVELDIVGLPLMRRWYVVHRAGRFMSGAAMAFVDFVVASAPGLLAELHPPVRNAKAVIKRSPRDARRPKTASR